MILQQLSEGAPRHRIGLRIKDKRPARASAMISDMQGKEIGTVTSGGVAADCADPIAMGYALKGTAPLWRAGDGHAAGPLVGPPRRRACLFGLIFILRANKNLSKMATL